MTGAQSLARPSLLLSRPAARLKLLRTLPNTPPLWASRPRSSGAGECELSLVRWCIFPAPLKRVFAMVTPCEPKYKKIETHPLPEGTQCPVSFACTLACASLSSFPSKLNAAISGSTERGAGVTTLPAPPLPVAYA